MSGTNDLDGEARRIRQRLVEVSDELRALVSDDFEAKHRLNLEADALRTQLVAELDDDTLSQWAERSARKASHSVDDGAEVARARIVSPMEGS